MTAKVKPFQFSGLSRRFTTILINPCQNHLWIRVIFQWNEKKRRRAESEIAAEIRMAREMLERQLSHAESKIERVRSSYIPKSGKKTKFQAVKNW